MLIEYLPILLLMLFAVGFAVANLAITHIVGPKRPTQAKLSVYESGVHAIGNTRHRFTIRYDLIAMLFIIFDVEVVFLYPWAIVFKKFVANSGYFILLEMLVFIGILFLGYVYAWRKGGLSWD